MTNQEIEKERREFEAWQQSLNNGDLLAFEYTDEAASGIIYHDVLMDYAWQGWFAAKQQSGWISVADKLPENRQVVLAYSNFWKEETRMCTNYYTDGEFVTYPSFKKTINVTHWQPLPAPPKGEYGAN